MVLGHRLSSGSATVKITQGKDLRSAKKEKKLRNKYFPGVQTEVSTGNRAGNLVRSHTMTFPFVLNDVWSKNFISLQKCFLIEAHFYIIWSLDLDTNPQKNSVIKYIIAVSVSYYYFKTVHTIYSLELISSGVVNVPGHGGGGWRKKINAWYLNTHMVYW